MSIFEKQDMKRVIRRLEEMEASESWVDWMIAQVVRKEIRETEVPFTISIDFDGVFHTHPWITPAEIPDGAVSGSIKWLLYLHGCPGIRICIFSCRNQTEAGRNAIRRWLVHHGFPFVDNLYLPVKKPLADIYIDDKAWYFDGIFPTIEQMKAHKPWYRKHE